MILKTLKAAANCLSRAGIPYMVIGGQAVLQYGLPRLTQDIDITLALTPEEVGTVLKAIESSFRTLPQDVEQFIRETWVLPVEHKETGVRVDLIFSLTGFEREAIEKAREITVEDMPIRYISPGDLIVQKVIAGRAVDLEDVRGILDMQGKEIDEKKVEERITVLSRETGIKQWLTRWKKVKT